MTNLKSNEEYHADLIPMGEVKHCTGLGELPSDFTADDTLWTNGQTVWNIFITLHNTDTGEIDEVMDLDIPVKLKTIAEEIFLILSARVDQCNLHRWIMT